MIGGRSALAGAVAPEQPSQKPRPGRLTPRLACAPARTPESSFPGRRLLLRRRG
jgi:hypothetical protein